MTEKTTGTIIDASGCALGRLASVAAKRLLLGEKIEVINSEKAIVTGEALEFYREKASRGSRDWGPFFPLQSNLILRRTVRGMLPFKNTRGREALKRLRVHIGVPAELADSKPEVIEFTKPKSRIHEHILLGKLSLMLGGKG